MQEALGVVVPMPAAPVEGKIFICASRLSILKKIEMIKVMK
jgi:hypothetical protein